MQLNINMEVGNYVYSISVSDFKKLPNKQEKNKLDATAKLLNFIKNNVSWPEKINSGFEINLVFLPKPKDY